MRKTILLHLLKFGLQRTAGPYSWVINGNRYLAAGGVLCPREQTSSVRSVTAHAVFFPKPTRDLPAASYRPFCVCQVAQIACGLLPRDVLISVEQRTPGNLDPDEWAILRRVIDLIQQNPSGAKLGPVLKTIENALRADQPKMSEEE